MEDFADMPVKVLFLLELVAGPQTTRMENTVVNLTITIMVAGQVWYETTNIPSPTIRVMLQTATHISRSSFSKGAYVTVALPEHPGSSLTLVPSG